MIDQERALFKAVYDRFADRSTVTLMARIIHERAFSAKAIDALFERESERQYTREILFSSLVEVMMLVVLGEHPSVFSAWKKNKHVITTSVQALYDKLRNVEPKVASALVRSMAAQCAQLIDSMDARRPALLPQFPLRILDGMHIEHTHRRLAKTRGSAAGPLPGFALAVYDVERDLISHAIFEQDGHAQERSRLDDVLPCVSPGECWVADRNFCTQAFLLALLDHGAHVLIREHAQMPWIAEQSSEPAGETEGGKLFKQQIRVGKSDTFEGKKLWRVTLELDDPTRDGDRELHIITDVLDHGVSAADVMRVYRARWSIERCFHTMATTLHAELNTLGAPGAAMFALAVGYCAYNVFSTLGAALRSAHGSETIDQGLSKHAVVTELKAMAGGLGVLVPDDLWVSYRRKPLEELGAELVTLARRFSLDNGYRKAPTPKKPPNRTPRTRFKGKPHISTKSVLDGRERDDE
jgi:hypothetical protein